MEDRAASIWQASATVVGAPRESRAPASWGVEPQEVPSNSEKRPRGSSRPSEWRDRHRRWVRLAYVVTDITCVAMSGVNAFIIRYSLRTARQTFSLIGGYRGGVSGGIGYLAFLGLYATLIVLLCQSQDLYRTPRTRSSSQESISVSKAVTFATLLLTAFMFLSGARFISRLIVAICAAQTLTLLIVWRLWKRQLVIRRVSNGTAARNAVIVGAGRIGQALARTMEENKLLGYRFLGFVDGNHSGDSRLLGKIEDLGRIAQSEFVDDVFITIPSEREIVKRVAIEGHNHRLHVKVVPELYDGLGWRAPIDHLGDFPVMELLGHPLPSAGQFFKRVLDVTVSGMALVALAPVLVAIGVSIRMDSEGTAMYRSKRVGRKGRVFTCYKFRTMRVDSDRLKKSLWHLNEREGPFFKISSDPRITRLGRILRKYSIDELPQLWNVLRGEMSLVGPRPHPVDDYERYSLEHLRRLEVKPGITGLWQVSARQDPSFDTNMKLDLDYIQQWNLWTDLKILLRTIPVALSGSGE